MGNAAWLSNSSPSVWPGLILQHHNGKEELLCDCAKSNVFSSIALSLIRPIAKNTCRQWSFHTSDIPSNAQQYRMQFFFRISFVCLFPCYLRWMLFYWIQFSSPVTTRSFLIRRSKEIACPYGTLCFFSFNWSWHPIFFKRQSSLSDETQLICSLLIYWKPLTTWVIRS